MFRTGEDHTPITPTTELDPPVDNLDVTSEPETQTSIPDTETPPTELPPKPITPSNAEKLTTALGSNPTPEQLSETMRQLVLNEGLTIDQIQSQAFVETLPPEQHYLLDQAVETMQDENILMANDKAFSFVGEILKDPNLPDELRKDAEEYGRSLLQNSKDILTKDVAPDQVEFIEKELKNKLAELGIEDTAEQLPEDTNLTATNLSTEDAPEGMLGRLLKFTDEKGEIMWGKLSLVAISVILLLASDSAIAKLTNQQALIPVILNGVTDVTHQIERTKLMLKLQLDEKDGKKTNNFDPKMLLAWMMGEHNKQQQSPQQPKEGA